MAELVDAPDSKSGGAKAPCRFEPDLRYSSIPAKPTKEGWQARAQAMKEEAKRWHSTSEIERRAELEAEALGVPYDEVLKRLGEESSGGGERGVREEVVF